MRLPTFISGVVLALPPIVGFQPPLGSGLIQRDEVREYLDAKSRFDREAQTATSTDALTSFVGAALKDLETRARRIIGPVSFRGSPGTFSLGSLPRQDPSGWVLDGLAFADTSTGTDVLVTTTGLLAGWLRQLSDTSHDPFVGLAREDILTWVFSRESHVYPYVDVLKTVALPKEIVLAQLVARSNDVVRGPPNELIVGVRRGSRIYLVNTRASRMTVPPECASALNAAIQTSGRFFDEEEAAFLSCYGRVGPRLPEFKPIVDQVRSLAARFR